MRESIEIEYWEGENANIEVLIINTHYSNRYHLVIDYLDELSSDVYANITKDRLDDVLRKVKYAKLRIRKTIYQPLTP